MKIFEGKVRQVGSSFGVLIPNEIVRGAKIRNKQIVQVAILKRDLSLLEKSFGSVKTKPFVREHRNRVV